ncbi:hypothetical protein K438DRAFT_1998348 [Mycena galopus ATCC 62051]|nr:hypothetical protein K438DRAFT_1998348 [Mycena galopus ATCC 62051]
MTTSFATTSLSAFLLIASDERLRTVAATTQVFAPPSKGPLVLTANYTSFSKSTPKDKATCNGKACNKIIHVWLVNPEFVTTVSTPIFESLVEQGILTNYKTITHLSEPNCETLSCRPIYQDRSNLAWGYLAAIGGDFFGMHHDDIQGCQLGDVPGEYACG